MQSVTGKIISAVYSNQEQSVRGKMMELWQYYKNSIFLCHQRLATHLSFAIVSAQNPAGVNVPAVYNRLLDKQLQAQLQQTGLAYR